MNSKQFSTAAIVFLMSSGVAVALPEYTVWCGGQSWFGWDDYSECTTNACSDIGGLPSPVITTGSDTINACYEDGKRLRIIDNDTGEDAMGPFQKN